MQWQNGFLGKGCCAWLGRGPGKRSERRSRHKAICPNGMCSFCFRLNSIRIQSGRRALRCFHLHHFIISNLWYNVFGFNIFCALL